MEARTDAVGWRKGDTGNHRKQAFMIVDPTDKRLPALMTGIEGIGAGELSTRVPAGTEQDSLSAIINSFNQMAQDLQRSQEQVQTRMKTRTTMLTDAFRKMELMALTDPLTQLRNRAALETVLESSLTEQGVNGSPALLLLDLDSFKSINDTLGHPAGDAVLKVVAERLRDTVRKIDTVARLGGDEFAVVLQDTPAERAKTVSRRIVAVLAEPMNIETTELSVGASVGIAAAMPGDSAADLILHADTAMYTAKNKAAVKVALFEPNLLNARRLHRVLAAELQDSIENNEMVLHYQPIVELATGKLLGVEALVRWQHPTRGLVMPDEFIDLAEEIGAMPNLAAWVLQTALARLRQWQQTLELDPRFTVRVNISATQLQRPYLLDDVQRLLLAEGIDPSALVLELTEYSMVTGNEWDLYSFQGLRKLGVGLAIDDFGTGYSSISYLRTLPVDGVKLDRSLIGGPTDGGASRPFIAAILQLVKSCNLAATCEGVETLEQAAMLTELGCETGQGYYFGRPVPAADITSSWLESFQGAPWLAVTAQP